MKPMTHSFECGPTPEPKKLSAGVWATLVSFLECYALNRKKPKANDLELKNIKTPILIASGEEKTQGYFGGI
jgi:hypothetical protein